LAYDGEVYHLPLPDGPGRAIRSMLPPTPVPMYVAALGPRNLELTGEKADGWLGNAFMPEHADAFLDHLRRGAEIAKRPLSDIDLVIPVAVEFTDDFEEAARRHSRGYAFTIGAMGSRDKNFYNAAFARQGYGDEVREVQDLWLSGRREEAADRVPLDIGAHTNLLGTPAMVKERLRLYAAAGITTLQAKLTGDGQEKLDTLAQLIDLI
jgi:alkanesulfonate monooxygenase SsuD/methylene tetrahydromethanopterin reductase-like flavin-dependent oxidoreductase (luciferase family)